MASSSMTSGVASSNPKTPWVIRFFLNLIIAFAILTSPAWLFMLLLECSFRYGPGRGDYPAVAPNADFATRRAWGQKEMFTYFDVVEQWVRDSNLIASDVGAVTGVAPIGAPNRFYAGGFTDGAHCVMNLQVVGEKGEGMLTLPIVNVNNGCELYGIADESKWSFRGKSELIVLSGKSWLEEKGFDTLVKQIRNYSEVEDHPSVVSTCELLRVAVSDFVWDETGQPLRQSWGVTDWFANLPPIYRTEMLREYADSLSAIGRMEDACKAYRCEATIHLERAEEFRYHGWQYRDKDDLPRSLQAAYVAITRALKLCPEDENVIDVAQRRTLLAHQVRCGNFGHAVDDLPEDEQRRVRQRAFGELYDCVVYRAKKSQWLQQQLGPMTFRPDLKNGNSLSINRHGLYQAYVSVEITGSWGRRGRLGMWIRENEDKHAPLDLSAATPRGPLYPLTHRQVSWTDANGDSTRLSAKTLAPYKKKKSSK